MMTSRGWLVDQAGAEGVDLVGPGGVLTGLTKQVLETALAGEMAEHLGYDRALVVKVRDGQVTNEPFYVVIGVTTAGERDILGIWAGDGGEGAKFWLNVLTEIKNRGCQRRGGF
jgi:transposase-like protein